jgi:hypothetical protein
MVRMQIIERPGTRLFMALKKAIRSKELRTFALERKSSRVVHVRSPGFMSWSYAGGVIACEVRSPKDPGKEWQLLTNVVGRLADRYPALVESIHIQLSPPPEAPAKRKRRGRRSS